MDWITRITVVEVVLIVVCVIGALICINHWSKS